jgi:hypothetical protein
LAAAATVDLGARASTPPLERHPWFAALCWAALLAPFFFLSYGFANWVTSQRAFVPSIVFRWEPSTPFLPWTIIPYWSSDLLYGISLAVCTTRSELHTHAKRLIAVQFIAILCFLAFPLRLTFERPETHGFFGWLFDALTSFDKPFNQAPSLHVSLAVILWNRFRPHLESWSRILMGAWLLLIVLSTMTTYQHQFIDLPTGALAGFLAIALFPLSNTRTSQRLRLATFYLSGAVLFTATACKLGAFAWILLWPAAATLTVAIAYLADRPALFLSPPIRLLTAPYIAAAWINSRCWTRRQTPAHEVADGVWLGRAPVWTFSWLRSSGGTGGFACQAGIKPADLLPRAVSFHSIVNCAPELNVGTRNIPMLDLVTPTTHQLQQATDAIEECAGDRPTLVCCALGVSRSAAAVAAWLLATERAETLEEATTTIRLRRPHARV